uniref:Arginine vasopressin receptor 2 n=1 Tax=Nothobranchius pienaari TaxID=704102 RepID=A0A1A8M386_9TELE
MERISAETAWDGLGLFSVDATGRNNFSLFVTELNSINASRNSGGSLFGIFPENGSNATPHALPPPRTRDLGLARAEIAVLGVVLALTTLGNGFVLWAYRVGAMSRWNTPVMVAWGLALVLSIPQVFIFSRSEVAPGEYECWGHFAEPWGLKAYVTWMTVAVFLLPALIITICQDLPGNSQQHLLEYSSCCEHQTAAATEEQMPSSSDFHESLTNSPRTSLDYVPPPPHPVTPPPSITKAMSKTVRMTLVIVLVYTVCWSPFFIVQLWAAWDPDPPNQGVAFTILMLLASLNSCTNPWIYTAFSSSVSGELQNLLHCRSRLGRRGSLPDDSTATHTSTTMEVCVADRTEAHAPRNAWKCKDMLLHTDPPPLTLLQSLDATTRCLITA